MAGGNFGKAKQGRFATRGLTPVQNGILSIWKSVRKQTNKTIK